MKFTGTIAVGQSGSIAGITASRNRFATYYRQRAIPVNPNSSFQQTVRSLFGTYAARWVTVLTSAQRAGWDAYAAALPGSPTGINEYVASNVMRRQLGTPLLTADDPPTIAGRATLGSILAATPSAGAGTTSVAYNNGDDWASAAGGALAIYQSRPYSQAINFFVGPYRLAANVRGAVVPPTSPVTVTSPFTLIAGQKVQFKYRCTNADGRLSAIVRQTITIGA